MAQRVRKEAPQYVMSMSEYCSLDGDITGGMNFRYRDGWSRWTKEWYAMVRARVPANHRQAFYSIAGKISSEVKREIAASREEKSGQQFFKF